MIVGLYTCRGLPITSMSRHAYWDSSTTLVKMPLLAYVTLTACLLSAACTMESYGVMCEMRMSMCFWQRMTQGMQRNAMVIWEIARNIDKYVLFTSDKINFVTVVFKWADVWFHHGLNVHKGGKHERK